MTDDATLELAARWLERARAGLTAQERAEFRRWLAERPEHAAATDMVARAWEAAPAAAALGGFSAPASTVAATEPRSVRTMPLRPLAWGGGLAGAALAALAVFWAGQPVTTRYATGAGERRQIALADGSQVWLAPGTRLTARIGWFSRHSTIEAGEAAFDVVHQLRDFSVEAGPMTVVDRGTLFAVRVREGATPRVVLARGAIAVHDRATNALLAEPAPGEAVELAGTRAVTRPVDAEALLSWRDGRLTFADTPLRDALVAFGEQGQTIRLGDPALATLRISGAYAIGDVESFLSALASIHPVRWTRVAGGYAIERR